MNKPFSAHSNQTFAIHENQENIFFRLSRVHSLYFIRFKTRNRDGRFAVAGHVIILLIHCYVTADD